ncbi:F-box protein At2g23160-like [Lycium barbarum]|uniref:F-box protein At2g23160-like n=1 Tax=Lycium barbarum TaxID=112863 RepID=UPI00293EDE42|nr:F-box protein At2g23160-like [Lycium barbarum]
MEGTLNKFAITTTKKRSPLPFRYRGTTERIQKRCRRTDEKHGFGDDIVMKILIFLPAKSLMRFKCVSKAWNALIRDPNFVKSHNARSQARRSAIHLLFELETPPLHKYSATTSATQSQLEGFSLQLAPHHYHSDTRSNMITCSNHCNGLVCVKFNEVDQVYLYNVTTGEIKALPFSLIYQYRWGPRLFLGFDTIAEKYKLLHVFYYKNRPTIKILTLGTNSWREIIPENSSPNVSFRGCIYLHGALYWTDSFHPINYFNIREEKFGIVSTPVMFCLGKLKIMLTALLGKLVFSFPKYEKLVVYDVVKKVFKKFNLSPNLEKIALLEEERIDKIKFADVLATASLLSAPASLAFPKGFLLSHASRFVENITPLKFIDF